MLEQKKETMKRSLSIDDELYHDKAATLPRRGVQNNQEVGFPIVDHTYSYKVYIEYVNI